MRALNSNQYRQRNFNDAQREFNQESKEFKAAKNERNQLREDRAETAHELRDAVKERDAATRQLEKAERGGNAQTITLAQEKLAIKNQNVTALKQQLTGINAELPGVQRQFVQERRDFKSAQKALDKVLPPEAKAERRTRRDVNQNLSFLKVQVENGEPLGIFKDSARKVLFDKFDIPINANLSDEAALKIARQRGDSPYFKAEQEARLELVQTNAESVSKTYDYGYREQRERGGDTAAGAVGRVTVSVEFNESAKILERPTNKGLNHPRNLSPDEVQKEKRAALREMKLELARTGAEELKQTVELKDGRKLELTVRADWKTTESVRQSESAGDRQIYTWKSYDEASKSNGSSRRDESISLPPSAKQQGIDSIKSIAAQKAKTIERVQEQVDIQGFVAQSRLEAVQAGATDGYKDRKIIGKNVYEVEVKVDFDVQTKHLNPNEPNFVEKRIQGNPLLTREEIATMRENFNKGLKQFTADGVQKLKEQLAVTGERVAEWTFTYKGEQHKVTVRADWDVDAELHRTADKPDVERHIREMLVASKGEDIAGRFKFYNGRAFDCTGEVNFDLKQKQLSAPGLSQLEQLEQAKDKLTPEQYKKMKDSINYQTRVELTAATDDMLNDLARTGEEKIRRLITTTTGERHELIATADWDVKVKKVDQFKEGLIKGMQIAATFASMVATAGTAAAATASAMGATIGATGAATASAISAGLNVLSSGIQGDWLGAGIGMVSLVGGLQTGTLLGDRLQFGARLAGTVRGMTDGKITMSDALSALGTLGNGLELAAGSTTDSLKIGNVLMDIDKYGSIIDSAMQGDGMAVFSGAANLLVGATARFRTQSIINGNQSNNQPPANINNNQPSNQSPTTGNNQGKPSRDLAAMVRETYDGIYARMDARAQQAADLVISNARRRGIDPAIAMAYVNNLRAEGSDVNALIRNNAARRGMSVAEYRRPFDRLLADQQANIAIIRNSRNGEIQPETKPADNNKPVDNNGGIVPIPTDKNGMDGRISELPLATGTDGQMQNLQFGGTYTQEYETGAAIRWTDRREGTTRIRELEAERIGTSGLRVGNADNLEDIGAAFLTGGDVAIGGQWGTYDYSPPTRQVQRTAQISERDRSGLQTLQLYENGRLVGLYVRDANTTLPIPRTLLENLPSMNDRMNPGDVFGDGSNVRYQISTDLDGNAFYSVSFTDSGLDNDAGRPGVGRTMIFDVQGRRVLTVTNYSNLRSVPDYSDEPHTDLRLPSNGIQVPDGGQERARDESRNVVDVLTAGGDRIATYQRQGDMYVLVPGSNIAVRQPSDSSTQTGMTSQELARTIQNNINGVARQYATDYVGISESKNTLQMMADQYRIRFGDGYADDMQRTYEQTLSRLNVVADDLQSGRISVNEANRRQTQIMNDYNTNLDRSVREFGSNAETGANIAGSMRDVGRSVTTTTVFLMSGGNPAAAVSAGTGYAEGFDAIAEAAGRRRGVATPNNQSATAVVIDAITNNQQNPVTTERVQQVLGQRGADAFNSVLDVAGARFIAGRTQQLTQTGMSQTRAAANAATEWQTISSGVDVTRTVIEVSSDPTLTPEQRMQRIQTAATNAVVNIPLAYPTGGLSLDNRNIQFGTNTLSSLTQNSITNGLTTGNFGVTQDQLFQSLVNGGTSYFSPTPTQINNGLQNNGGGRGSEYTFANNVRINEDGTIISSNPAEPTRNLNSSTDGDNRVDLAPNVDLGAANAFLNQNFQAQTYVVPQNPTAQINVHGEIGLNPDVTVPAIGVTDLGDISVYSPSVLGADLNNDYANDFTLSENSSFRFPRIAPDVTLRREVPGSGRAPIITQDPVLINGRPLPANQVEQLFGGRETINLSELIANGRRMGIIRDNDVILLNSCLASDSQTITGTGGMTIVGVNGGGVSVRSILNGDINTLANDPEFQQFQQTWLQQNSGSNQSPQLTDPETRGGRRRTPNNPNSGPQLGFDPNFTAQANAEANKIAQQLGGGADEIPLDTILGLANKERIARRLPPLNPSLRAQLAGDTPSVFENGQITSFGRTVYNIQRAETNSLGQPMVRMRIPTGGTNPDGTPEYRIDYSEMTGAEPAGTIYELWRDARTLRNGDRYDARYIPIDNGTNINAGHQIPAAIIVQELIAGGARNADIRDMMLWPANYRLEFAPYNKANGSGGVSYPNVLVSPFYSPLPPR